MRSNFILDKEPENLLRTLSVVRRTETGPVDKALAFSITDTFEVTSILSSSVTLITIHRVCENLITFYARACIITRL